jgi:hypothetical protein
MAYNPVKKKASVQFGRGGGGSCPQVFVVGITYRFSTAINK